MEAVQAIVLVLSLAVYGWLWYRCILLAEEKAYPYWGVSILCLLTTPLVVYIMLMLMPSRAKAGERRLSVEELTAVFEAKAARIEAARDGQMQ